MTDDTLTSHPTPSGDPLAVRPLPGPAERGGTWGLGWAGVRTVAVLELRQRIRSTRWVAVLAVWTAVLGGLTVLIRWGIHRAYVGVRVDDGLGGDGVVVDPTPGVDVLAGRVTFGVIVFLVLSLAGLVAPALSATSINGDRQAGVLATLQTTLLTPAQIVVGKLLAAWATAMALLAAALPFVLWIYAGSGTPAGRLLGTLGVLALTLLVVCAVGLGWSAITARTSSSAVLTYLTIALLGPGLPLLFALSVPIVTQPSQVQVRKFVETSNSTGECRVVTEQRVLTHTERSWWLLAASPYVVVADAAPKPTGTQRDDPLSTIRQAVREARLGPELPVDECGYTDAMAAQRQADQDALGVTWPYGLGALLALGAGFTAIAVRRLRTPTRRLPSGTRVA
jgi:ABC-type transport system involved in multi-copper enzyme maturation permease subunit